MESTTYKQQHTKACWLVTTDAGRTPMIFCISLKHACNFKNRVSFSGPERDVSDRSNEASDLCREGEVRREKST